MEHRCALPRGDRAGARASSAARWLVAAAIAGCSPYDPELSDTPFLCGSEAPRCPEGYACIADPDGRMVCSTRPAAPGTAGQISCAEDSPLETSARNDTIETAYRSPIAGPQRSIVLAPLAICPAGDRDTFAVQITGSQQDLQAIASWTVGLPVEVHILDGAGKTVATGGPAGDGLRRAYVASVPAGTFYVQTSAAGITDRYRVEITVTGP
jgi:hypothetical protein